MMRRSQPIRLLVFAATATIVLASACNELPATSIESTPPAPWQASTTANGVSVDGDPDAAMRNKAVLLMESLQQGTLHATFDRIDIRGVTLDADDWDRRLIEFRAGLPDELAVSVDVARIEVSDDATALCTRMMSAVTANTRIEFLLSTNEMRSAAQGQLQRIADVIGRCPQLALLVVGHSDSSGNERSNVALSLSRAEAVVQTLQQYGATPSQLQVMGRGSAEPIADNATRHGRAANRRIEFELVAPE